MPKVLHFEIAADNPERAVEFWLKLSDGILKSGKEEFEYWLVDAGAEDEAGINGAIKPREDGSIALPLALILR